MPGRRSWTRRVRWTVWVLAVAAAGVGLWWMAADADRVGGPIAVVAAADVVLGLAFLVSRDSLDPRSIGRAMSATVAPVVSALLLETLVGFLLFPVTLEDGVEPDRSWFGVVPLVVWLVGGGALLLAMLAHLMVLAPVIRIVLDSPAAVRGDVEARASVLLSLVLVDVVAMAVALALVVDSGSRRRAGLLDLLLTVLGVQEPSAGSSDLQLWVARLLVAVFAVLVTALAVLHRRHPEVDRVWQARR
ncbi:hypothetical protein [Nocardioides dongxiaopingii]|uniref:hypothetical protein n=1 Tax=Nocardioides dongxiaopingii TaxID=2576036 RepID=UPI0010C763F8|nr:hypothetical protein [Nocardioides dongxiaopingii]